MPELVINPWPFEEGEIVELYWLCSPFRNSRGYWTLKAVFKRDNGEYVSWLIPFGAIYGLKMGRKYCDGRCLPADENTYKITLDKSTRFEIVDAFNISKELRNFEGKREYGIQAVVRFTSRERTIYIPCVEILRAFFTPYTYLANRLYKPNGLERIIAEEKIEGRKLTMFLKDEYPHNLLQNSAIAHLVWLLHNPLARKNWIKIYNEYFFLSKESSSSHDPDCKGKRIELLPPVDFYSEWSYRGVCHNNAVLITEISGYSNLHLPFNNIEYSHPRIYRFEQDNSGPARNSTRYIPIEKGNMVELDKNGEASSRHSNEAVVDSEQISISFLFPLKIKKIAQSTKSKTSAPEKGQVKVKVIEKIKKTVKASALDWERQGKIRPLEFDSLGIDEKNTSYEGLEKFVKSMELLSLMKGIRSVSMKVIKLDGNNSFVVSTDGQRRLCAIVEVIRDNTNMPCYILEPSRADKWHVSTLIFSHDNKDGQNTPDFIKILINHLILCYGHWNLNYLSNILKLNYTISKHFTNDYEKLAFKLMGKVMSS